MDKRQLMENLEGLTIQSKVDGYSNRAEIVTYKGNRFLISYNTVVAYQSNRGKFYRLWDRYSVTTMRHLYLFGWNIGKKEWLKNKVYSLPKKYTYISKYAETREVTICDYAFGYAASF